MYVDVCIVTKKVSPPFPKVYDSLESYPNQSLSLKQLLTSFLLLSIASISYEFYK